MKWQQQNYLRNQLLCSDKIRESEQGVLGNNAYKHSPWKENPIFGVRANKQADVNTRGKEGAFLYTSQYIS